MVIANKIRKLNLSKLQITIILSGFYIFFSLIANVSATKVTYLGSLVTDAGFIYYLTFTWRDLIHKQLGKRIALTTIYLAGILNILAALYFQFVTTLPAESGWALAGGQSAWAFIFSLQLRIVIASVIAQVISEIADTETYQRWVDGVGKKLPQWTRVIVSNAISIPIDSLLFPLIAFSGILSTQMMWQMFITNIILKGVFTLLTFWMIYLVPEKPIYVER